MEMSLLEAESQPMTLLTPSFLTMKATPLRCLESTPLNHIMNTSSVDVSPKHSHLFSASPMISQW
ncbi:hypothetical protein DPMN_000420 [Dreissena polymorpha]|uniref:Uncharacterized protein n=1 Tax=Dreissena polymorpha TaxID=45954 RepID=A0A9D4MI75_DREPO|nr:hypothetical protein DPMN_000420 [Dreissena polymorpha]